MKFALALVTPLFNLLLLFKGSEFYGWLADWMLEIKIDNHSDLKLLKGEVIPHAKYYGDVNSLMSGVVAAAVGALVFAAMDPRPTLRFLFPACYFALALVISQRLRAIRLSGDLSGYNSQPEAADGTKSSVRKLRKWTTILSGAPAGIALFDQLAGWAAGHLPWLVPVSKFLLGQ